MEARESGGNDDDDEEDEVEEVEEGVRIDDDEGILGEIERGEIGG